MNKANLTAYKLVKKEKLKDIHSTGYWLSTYQNRCQSYADRE